MINKINLRSFEDKFENMNLLIKIINKFIVSENLEILSISENIFFKLIDKKKVRFVRLNLYFKKSDLENIYIFGRKMFESLKCDEDLNISKINKFIDLNKEKIKLLCFSNNPYFDESNKLKSRISVFFTQKYIKEN